MVQITTTQDHQPAGAAPNLAGKGQGTTLRLVHTAPTATKYPASGSAAAEMSQGNDTLVHFWLDQASKQVACTAQTLWKLATARSWQERLEIQSAFVSGSLTWLNEGMTRYAAVTNAMVARSREARVSAAAAPRNRATEHIARFWWLATPVFK